MSFQLSNEVNQPASIGQWRSVNDEQHQWWRTRPSWTADSWAFEPQDDSQGRRKRRTPHSYLVSLPSAIHLGSGDDGSVGFDELRLDSGLVGVRLVEEAVRPYEKAVGFPFVLFPEIEQADLGPMARPNLYADEDEIIDNNRVWSESLQDFISSVQDIATPDTEGSMSSSFIDSELSSGSDNSNEFFATPATPVHAGSTFSDVLVKSASPDSSFSSTEGLFSSPTPRKSLNAFASSFVPSFSPPAHSGTFSLASITDSLKEKKKSAKSGTKKRDNADSLSSFTFPTLNPPTKSTTRLTTVKIKKDDQGFFTTDVQVDKSKAGKASSPAEVAGPERPSQLLLPPFLQEPTPRRRARASRTRELVDQLRSDQTEATSPLSATFDGTIEPKDTNLKAGLEYPFDLALKSASTSHSPSPIEDVVIRPRSSVSEDGAGQRSSTADDKDSQSQSGLSSPSLDEDDEGWIDLGASSVVSSLSTGKRARDLFLAFTRRRTDSISSEPTKEPLPSSEHMKTKSQDVKAEFVQDSKRAKEKPLAKTSKPPKKSQWGNRDRIFRPNGNIKPMPAPTPAKSNHRKKSSANPHGRHHSTQGTTPLSANAARFTPSGPAFPSLNNPPYVNPAPPSHMNVMPAAPAPVPGTFFFNPTTPAYHPLGLGSTGVPPMPGVYGPAPVPVGFVPVRVPAAPYMPAHMAGAVPPHAGPTHHRKASSTLSAW
ncbi:hypothetical protein BKA70DRAFT_1272787 [Coprinopsis sp. MPI-PUGE-AT-0042]|nr:hypothetical protein BKA70DRAFT_1272787 [Coprinopsis sp. MPI-PUGE-AT-0042]